MLLAALPAVRAAAAATPAADCTYLVNTDFAQGSGGPNAPAPNASACCQQCLAAGPSCHASVFDLATGGVCWLKTQAQTLKPVFAQGLVACWPPGSPPPPPPLVSATSTPSPTPPPPLYTVTQLSRADTPVIGFQAPPANTAWPQAFNPAFVAPSAGTGHKRGLLVRSQNCSQWAPGVCIACNVDGAHPIAPWFPGSVLTFAEQRADGSFAPAYLVFAPEPGNQFEQFGTEDPRLTYDPATGLYHLFYTCYGVGGRLCHATTLDPTAPYPGAWTRLGAVFGPGTKSGALLIRPAPPHYLYWGDSQIHLAESDNLVNFTTTVPVFIDTRPGHFDSELVEAGPSPQLLSTGDYVFFHNSAGPGGYHAEYVILNGTHPAAPYLQRAQQPILSPLYDFELGVAPAECNVPNVVFLECVGGGGVRTHTRAHAPRQCLTSHTRMHASPAPAPTPYYRAVAPVDGAVDTFDVWFGGSDAVVSTARFQVTRTGKHY